MCPMRTVLSPVLCEHQSKSAVPKFTLFVLYSLLNTSCGSGILGYQSSITEGVEVFRLYGL